ncbi:hypothetical protein ACKA04_02365 [Helcococcus kunzii]|uniref:hypothetical protein n=1 Tax=Helcococcus kunzii TaxID=40091 RepID=UPI0038AE2C34
MPSDKKVREAVFEKYFRNEEWEKEITQLTSERKRMAEYCRCSLFELDNLPLTLYLVIKRDSWIESMNQNDEGRQILKELWRLQQTSADLNKIRAKGVKEV